MHGQSPIQHVGVDGKALAVSSSGAKPFVDAANSVRFIEVPAVDDERISNALVKKDFAQSQKILGMGFKIGVAEKASRNRWGVVRLPMYFNTISETWYVMI